MGAHADPDKIARAMADLDIMEYGDVLQCMRCGLCLPTCPTYKTDGVETQSPRGRVAMIRAVIDGRLTASEDFIEHMYHCLDCRNCQTVCPAGVRGGELVLEARHRIEENRRRPLIERFLLKHAVRDQRRLSLYMAPVRLYERAGLQSLIRRYGILRLFSEDLEFMEALLPPLPKRPLSESLPEEIPARGPEKGRVGFFLGCAMNLIFSEVSRATIELIAASGYRVIIPKGQQCCGAPNIAEGERTVYREMAEHNLVLFEKAAVDFVVTDCAACGAELKEYPARLIHRSATAQRAEAIALKVRDVSEFLATSMGAKLKFKSSSEVVCFHDPCHLRHAQKLVSPQREVLRRVPGIILVEIPDQGQCCGSAGIYNITHRERSMKILAAKVEAIRKTGAHRVVTSNPGCIMQLEYARKHWEAEWDVTHISRFLLDAVEDH